ncbi:MAG: CocE/NonD family hydrolase [SAR324 cluster bacterium]|nr:CocE/NonD family hydrolase [SAR324 cluster bacterium]
MGQQNFQAPSDAEVLVEHDVMVPMRDGKLLATDIYRPAREGRPIPDPLPVILERTPYDKTGTRLSEKSLENPVPLSNPEIARYFVKFGYIVVFQDCRGRYNSEGDFTKYLGEGPDGYDTVEWIMQQAWCSGKIGTMGLSYSAHVQSAMACFNPPGLTCMLLDSGGFSNAYQGGIRQGGAFELKQATWAFKHAGLSRYAEKHPEAKKALEQENIFEWFSRMPWRPGHSPVKWIPEYEDFLLAQWTHGEFDQFWKQVGIYAEGYYENYSDVPMLHISSWYDPYTRTATENFCGLVKQKKGPVRLILGPWLHGRRSQQFSGDVDFGPAATLDRNLAENYFVFRRKWFDCWLKGINNGVEKEPAVRYFLMGGGSGLRNQDGRLDHGGKWRSASDWPLPHAEYVPFYLHKNNLLAPEFPSESEFKYSYRYDPGNPVPTIGGPITSGQPIMEGGAFDQREENRFFGSKKPYQALAFRDDVLVFESRLLENDLEITGPIVVKLWISSDCVDTDFTVKLIDSYPPNADYPQGFAMNICNGILRVRYRNSWENPEMMIPEKIYQIQIDPPPASNLFKAGHRIRLDISSSNFPHFDLNYNTGEPEGTSRYAKIARNTVFADSKRPSHLVLPVVPHSASHDL